MIRDILRYFQVACLNLTLKYHDIEVQLMNAVVIFSAIFGPSFLFSFNFKPYSILLSAFKQLQKSYTVVYSFAIVFAMTEDTPLLHNVYN